MSMYLLPKTTSDRLDKQRRSFFWQGGGQKKKYHLVRWDVINKSKKQGGLGVKNIQKMNTSLLCKWWWKLEYEEGMWLSIVKKKYLQREAVSSVRHKMDDSPVWHDLLKIKHIYLRGRTFSVKNGRKTSLWTDTWISDKPLCILYPVLFDLCVNKNISVFNFLTINGQVQFSRWLPSLLFEQWIEVVNNIYNHVF